MYKQFFGLTKSPFRLTPDPHFLFLTPAHREALSGLVYAISGHGGLAVLSGDAGTGKTTLLRMLLESMPRSLVEFSYLLMPTVSPADFLRLVLMDFGMADVPLDRPTCIQKLQDFLVSRRAQGRLPVLVVDEAHKLDIQVLEELRLLTNFEDANGKLLQIVLAGQNELDGILKREELRQFKQRIAHRFSVVPLSDREVGQYIRHRWLRAGATRADPFTEEAILQVALYSRGIPRVVNTLCDNSLLLAFGAGITRIGPEHVQEVATDLDITLERPVAEAPEKSLPQRREADRALSPAPVATEPKPAVDQPQAAPEPRPRDGPARGIASLFEGLFGRRDKTIRLRLREDRS